MFMSLEAWFHALLAVDFLLLVFIYIMFRIKLWSHVVVGVSLFVFSLGEVGALWSSLNVH